MVVIMRRPNLIREPFKQRINAKTFVDYGSNFRIDPFFESCDLFEKNEQYLKASHLCHFQIRITVSYSAILFSCLLFFIM